MADGPDAEAERSVRTHLALVAAALLATGTAAAAQPNRVVEERISLPGYGTAKLYRPEPVRLARALMLFVSGDGGWNLGVVDMARRAAARDTVVVGLSMPALKKAAEKASARCWYPAGDLETMAQTVEKRLGFPRYLRPVLVGYSSGATLVYGALAQAPATTFAGAISLGFCADLEVARPFCGRDAWKPSYDPKKRVSLLPAGGDPRPPWTVLQGEADQVCDAGETSRFAAKVPGATLVPLPKVGHGFSVPRNWGAAFDAAIDRFLAGSSAWEPVAEAQRHEVPNRAPAEIARSLDALGLPLEIQWPDGARDVLVFLSGDGGWAEIDQEVSSRLAAAGVAVVGWSSLRYFWDEKTPGDVRADLARVIDAIPPENRVFVGGYSFGAEVVPVALSADALPRVAGLVLLAPGLSASFEIRPLDWLGVPADGSGYAVPKALASGRLPPVLCLEPAGEDHSGCVGPGVEKVSLPGGHHFGGDFGALAARILRFLERGTSALHPARGSG
jgi:type IV secretory pathway VirJ component